MSYKFIFRMQSTGNTPMVTILMVFRRLIYDHPHAHRMKSMVVVKIWNVSLICMELL